ncbi:MAG: hypothetical protein ACLTG0_07750 [Oscillibacter sp.]
MGSLSVSATPTAGFCSTTSNRRTCTAAAAVAAARQAFCAGICCAGCARGKWNRIIFAPTGALLSPTTTFQGESIPGICHAVVFSNHKEG